jgi:hypothetical protein
MFRQTPKHQSQLTVPITEKPGEEEELHDGRQGEDEPELSAQEYIYIYRERERERER